MKVLCAIALLICLACIPSALAGENYIDCSASPNPAVIGDTVTFSVADLSGQNFLRYWNGDSFHFVAMGKAKTFTYSVVKASYAFYFEVFRDDGSGTFEIKPNSNYYKCKVVD